MSKFWTFLVGIILLAPLAKAGGPVYEYIGHVKGHTKGGDITFEYLMVDAENHILTVKNKKGEVIFDGSPKYELSSGGRNIPSVFFHKFYFRDKSDVLHEIVISTKYLNWERDITKPEYDSRVPHHNKAFTHLKIYDGSWWPYKNNTTLQVFVDGKVLSEAEVKAPKAAVAGMSAAACRASL